MLKPKTDANFRPLPSWRSMHADTSPWAEEIQLKFFREAPAWRKLEMAGELTLGMVLLAESGIQTRYPNEPQAKIRRRLADVVLGPELAEKVYGQLNDV